MRVSKNILLVDIHTTCDLEDTTVIEVSKGSEAMQLICRYNFDLIAARWNLKDMPDGLLFNRAKQMWLSCTLMAIVEAGNRQQELSARQAGADIVINDDYCQFELFNLFGELLGNKNRILEVKK